ncbi:MAG: hypothetical protein Q4C87_03995 [Actinomycetaceae bacterium]|nr:hypothetical protein [Actinomycetaceae bacterium]
MNALDTLQSVRGVIRAWPGMDRGITFESRDHSGSLRAGRISSAGRVHLTSAGRDPHLPTLDGGNIVVHRFGRRAVEIQNDRVRKHFLYGKAASVAYAIDAITPAVRAAGMNIPQVMEATNEYVDIALVDGIEIGDKSCPTTAWEMLCEMWPGFASADANLPIHSGADEAKVLQSWVKKARDYGTIDRIDEVEAQAEKITGGLREGSWPLVVAHRDLHEKQVLWDGEQISLIDVDTAALSEASLDIGNLRAHLELHHLRQAIDQDTFSARSGLIDELIHRMSIDESRLSLYLQSARLRIACVHSFRPASQIWLPEWLDFTLTTDSAKTAI